MSKIMARTRTPWDKLIQAFINNVPTRMALMDVCPPVDVSSELYDFRLLELRGPRYCGKTESLIQFILKNENVKFTIQEASVNYYKERLGEEKFQKAYVSDAMIFDCNQELKKLDSNPFENTKVMIFDDAGNSSWIYFNRFYRHCKDKFDPEFMIIKMN